MKLDILNFLLVLTNQSRRKMEVDDDGYVHAPGKCPPKGSCVVPATPGNITNLTTTSDMNMDLNLTTAPPINTEAQHCQHLLQRKNTQHTKRQDMMRRWDL
ncbi:hypothetical protein CEXT_340561 [Caerostris extrusa]|uniref:Uncharacterized protein n=1 Tax=Caerostris extrusa TaxID=172846 RepID=A0AAV4MY80_CAEEX|nr:hypothetical protein CEXT_340561 [Caerostris extrusa]